MVKDVDARVLTGRETRFDGPLRVDGQLVIGRVVTVADKTPVPGGNVILFGIRPEGEENSYETVDVNDEGLFRGIVDPGMREVTAFYARLDGFGECVSEVRSLHG